MKKNVVAAIILLVIIQISVLAYASNDTKPITQSETGISLDYDSEDGVINLDASFGAGLSYKNVAVQVFGPLNDPGELEQLAKQATYQIYAEQAVLDVDGLFSFRYQVKDINSFYLLAVNVDGLTAPLAKNVLAYTKQTELDALSAINNALDSEMLKGVFASAEYENLLIKNVSLMNYVVDTAKRQRICEQIINQRPVGGYTDFAAYSAVSLPIILAQAASNMATAQEIKETAEQHGVLNDDPLYDRYANMSAIDKLSVFSRMEGIDFKDFTDFMLRYSQSIFLQMVESEKYSQNLTQLINDNAERLGIKDMGYKGVENHVNNKLLGNHYSNIAEFNEDLQKNIPASTSNTSTGTNSYGGGSAVNSAWIPAPTYGDVPNDEDSIVVIFSDLAGYEWAEPYILDLHEQGILQGRGDGLFYPGDYVTREEFVKMLICAFGLTDNTAKCDFIDTNMEDWHYLYIATAVQKGIANGVDESNFGVGLNIIRQDAAVMLHRQLGVRLGEAKSFSDADLISDYARSAVDQLSALNIISGTTTGEFEPLRPVLRAEAAKIIAITQKEIGGVKE